jgi:lipooligosaccharide transport system ATP-binding protein
MPAMSIDPSDNILEARGLTKIFDDEPAVDGISFSLRRQECLGFLGPNGAGKTTTVRMISCFCEPTRGSLSVLGQDARRAPRLIKARLGICPQENNLDPDLKVFDNLRVYLRYFDKVGPAALARCEELLHFVGLYGRRASAIDELSGGMKRRLVMARALLNEPEFLILDEPTTGLDPQARHQIWEMVTRLKRQGTTVLLTTHYMDEAEHLCDRVVIMDHGKILMEGAPRDLIRKHIGANVIEVASQDPGFEIFLKEMGLSFEKSSTHYFVYVKNGQDEFRAIAAHLGDGVCVLRMANLEDVFLKATGRELRE